jgi:hypothetical protein
MDRHSIARLVQCAEVELRKRETCYPRKIETGKMSLRKAKEEIENMRQITVILRALEAEHAKKLGLSI